MAGLYTGTDLADKTFIGFKVDPVTGKGTVEIIRNGEAVINLPSSDTVNPSGYLTYVWTRDTLQFAVTSNGHLQVTYV